jgi:hypothetical protein
MKPGLLGFTGPIAASRVAHFGAGMLGTDAGLAAFEA